MASPPLPHAAPCHPVPTRRPPTPPAVQPAAAGLWACLAGLMLLAAAAIAKGELHAALWRHVLVEPPLLTPTVIQTQRNLSTVSCGAACMRKDWCRLWCHEAPRWCLLTSLTVSASYTPSQPDGAHFCYTSRLPDLTVGAAITSSPQPYANRKVKEYLIDGIYGGNIWECGLVTEDDGAYAWFLLDLGATYPISEVLLVAQPNTNAKLFFRDIEVRVGSVQLSGNFTTYQLLGTFTGIAEPEQIVVLRLAAPITGRYISIQRTTPNHLQIAHLEIR